MEPKSGYNRRITEILLRYWLDLRDEREMPQEKEINPANLVDVWGNCFLVQMTNAAAYGGYRYTYLGKDLVDAFGEDVSREDAEMLVSLPSMRVTSKFDQAVGMRKPLIDEGEFLNGKKVSIKYRQILLPIASNKNPKELAYLFGGMRWKGF